MIHKGGATTFYLASKSQHKDNKILGFKAIKRVHDDQYLEASEQSIADYVGKAPVVVVEALTKNEMVVAIQSDINKKVSFTKISKSDPSWQYSIEELIECSFPNKDDIIGSKSEDNFHIYISSMVGGDRSEDFQECYDYFYKSIGIHNITVKSCKSYTRHPQIFSETKDGTIFFDFNNNIFQFEDNSIFSASEMVSAENLLGKVDYFDSV